VPTTWTPSFHVRPLLPIAALCHPSNRHEYYDSFGDLPAQNPSLSPTTPLILGIIQCQCGFIGAVGSVGSINPITSHRPHPGAVWCVMADMWRVEQVAQMAREFGRPPLPDGTKHSISLQVSPRSLSIAFATRWFSRCRTDEQ